MVLNLLQTHTLEQAKELVERSFGQYVERLKLKPQHEGSRNLPPNQEQLAYVDIRQLDTMKLRQRLKEASY